MVITSSGHLQLSVHEFCIRVMPCIQTRPDICSDLEDFVALKQCELKGLMSSKFNAMSQVRR